MNLTTFLTSTVPGLLVLFTPIILGLVEVAKRAGMPSGFAPFAALTIGVVIGIFFSPAGVPIQYEVLLGVIAGLSSMGLYSGTAKTVDSLKNTLG